MSVPEGSAAAGVGDEAAPRRRRERLRGRAGSGRPGGSGARPLSLGRLVRLTSVAPLIKAPRVWREGDVCSSVSGVISAVHLGYLRVSCFSGDTFRNADYSFEEGEGPKIVIGEKQENVCQTHYFKVVF